MTPPAALPAVITPALLSCIRAHPQLPKHSWYFITGVTLSVINRPDEIPKVFKDVMDHGIGASDSKPEHEEQLRIARRLREALLKSAPIAGLPRVINALFALKSVTPPSLLDEPTGYSPTARPAELYETAPSQILSRGQNFFDQLYGKVSKRIMGQMDRSGTEDLGVTARLMYGYLLSNTNVLTAAESSFVVMAGLIPLDVNPQLKGHLKGAINNGATVEEVRAVREVVMKICEASGMKRLADDQAGGWGWRGEVANL
ncbi:MAG: hypothetical protein M1819_003667 [Sarea resinae]|nr:MAG: hypothetical protein M1819_003667 [Sarea resinae]